MNLLSQILEVFFCLVLLQSVFSVNGMPKFDDDFSGDNSLEIDDEDENFKLKSTTRRILVDLDVSEIIFDENSTNMKILNQALEKYLIDLSSKIVQSEKSIKLFDLKTEQLTSKHQQNIKFTANCKSKDSKTAKLECQTIAEKIRRRFSVNELLRYFHENGFTEKVTEGLDKILPQDEGFYFINASIEEIEIPPKTPLPDFDEFDVEIFSSEYNPDNYDLVDDRPNNYNLVVDEVEQLGVNHFKVLAYLMKYYDNVDDEFKRKFKDYVENTFRDSLKYEINEEISVNLTFGTKNEFDNETALSFDLITTNIDINGTDDLQYFDEIFEFFNLDAFDALLKDNESEIDLMEDGLTNEAARSSEYTENRTFSEIQFDLDDNRNMSDRRDSTEVSTEEESTTIEANEEFTEISLTTNEVSTNEVSTNEVEPYTIMIEICNGTTEVSPTSKDRGTGHFSITEFIKSLNVLNESSSSQRNSLQISILVFSWMILQ